LADVRWLLEAQEELDNVPINERGAVQHAADKLEALGDRLSYPHQSAIRGAENLRELRPRGGNSPWRAFYRRVGPSKFVIAAVGAEATANPRGFRRAVEAATLRLAALQGDDP
jgi:hypothetical protein